MFSRNLFAVVVVVFVDADAQTRARAQRIRVNPRIEYAHMPTNQQSPSSTRAHAFNAHDSIGIRHLHHFGSRTANTECSSSPVQHTTTTEPKYTHTHKHASTATPPYIFTVERSTIRARTAFAHAHRGQIKILENIPNERSQCNVGTIGIAFCAYLRTYHIIDV